MPDEINTLETLGVTPRFVLQHNAISRSIQDLSATAKKLTAMAMALLPTDLSNLTVSFSFVDFCRAIGYTKSGESFKLFKAAIDECMDNKIYIETVSPKTGERIWEKYTWFTYSRLEEKSGNAKMTFSEKLANILKEMQRVYAKINLQDLGKLQSKYALRYFEIAKSYESLAGKDGNKSRSWYYERTLPELRQILAIQEDSYPKTSKFREKVIEAPVKEINEAGIGITIETTALKQGRNLKAIRFDCHKTDRPLQSKRVRGRPRKNPAPDGQLTLPEAAPKQTRMEKELDHLKERYPDEFAALYAAEMAKPSFAPAESLIRRRAAEASAVAALREKHGIVK